jgi:DNA (cytosine-5)-methyltransferase 1
MNHIELFAGCGGLSLGLESEGFSLLMANELSPMASETFAFNHLGLNLKDEWDPLADKVYWLKSEFARHEKIELRLKENPLKAKELGEACYSDLQSMELTNEALNRSLLVGSILDLNAQVEGSPELQKLLKSGFGAGEVDLVSGGPPCQSFSMAGLRQHSNERNSLPWAFAEYVRLVQPKMALMENVSGILRPFNIDGKSYYAWYEVAKAFSKEGYVPLCLHVNAKYCGAAQNRPRYVMLAFRHDIAKKILSSDDTPDQVLKAFKQSEAFYSAAKVNDDLEYGMLTCHEISQSPIFESVIFKPLTTHLNGNFATVQDAIDDLREGGSKSEYVERINSKSFGKQQGQNLPISNNELRKNGALVRARFRLYQVMSQLEPQYRKELTNFLKTGEEHLLSDKALKALTNAGDLIRPDQRPFPKRSRSEKISVLHEMRTKKQTQRALIANQPAPAALSIPDDACHYHEDELRTLTVREMARIQSFPDWFVFQSKVTTGGQMRKFQVPQYTQVGNAVPPLLGKALGKVCRRLLTLAGSL